MASLLYLFSAVLFIFSLKGLSSPKTSRLGNTLGMVGMAVAILTTFNIGHNLIVPMVGIAILIGALIGIFAAKKVEMTSMPELVALMHSFVGLAAVLIAIAAVFNTNDVHSDAQRIELCIGAFIGAITFSASVVAFGKLSGKFSAKMIQFKGQHLFNLFLFIAMISAGIFFYGTHNTSIFLLMCFIAFALGVTLIIPIGGADMPVVVSMLNSYSGWAAAGIGFSLNNSVLIIAGACVGASGTILSYIMCKAMNRSIVSVLLGGFGADTSTLDDSSQVQKIAKSGSVEDVAFLLSNADSVIIVPGYGLAVARAQHALQELTTKLNSKSIKVKYAIHPVAGRMPGHMNVLLAEADVPYELITEMEEINHEFGETDVVLVIGANDVVNPQAKKPGSPIYGMPILEAYKAKTIIVNKRSMSVGYAGLDNELFYLDKTMMIFGDAKKIIDEIIKVID